MKSRGAIYCAYGTRYIDLCADSARSLQYHNPTLGVALFTDRPEYALERFGDVFTHIEPLVHDAASAEDLAALRDRRKLPSLKVLICDRTPFDQTLSIDGDTLVLGSLDEAFRQLSNYQLLACRRSAFGA